MSEKISYKDLRDTLKEMQNTTDMYASIIENMLSKDGIDPNNARVLLTNITEEDIRLADDVSLMNIMHRIMLTKDARENDKDTDKNLTQNATLISEDDVTESTENEHIDSILEQFYIDTKCKNDINYQKNEDWYASVSKNSTNVIDCTKYNKEKDKIVSRYEEEWAKSKEMLYPSVIREFLLSHQKEFFDLEESYRKCDELKEEARRSMNDYVESVTSEEVLQKEDARIAELKELLAIPPENPELAETYQEELDELETKRSHSYLYRYFKRFDEKKSCQRIVDNFFNVGKSQYMLKRAGQKLRALGYDPKVYRAFIQLEERKLPKEYHVFNNLFLAFVLDHICYINVDKEEDVRHVKNIIAQLGYLVFDKFASERAKEEFLMVITNFLDRFEDYRELFTTKNSSSPTHPARIEQTKKKEDEIRQMIFVNLEDEGYKVTDELKALDLDDLREFYDGWLEALEKDKKEAAKSKVNDIIEALRLNTEGHTREKLKKEYMALAEWTEDTDRLFNTEEISVLEQRIKEAKEKTVQKQKQMDEASLLNSDKPQPERSERGESDGTEN